MISYNIYGLHYSIPLWIIYLVKEAEENFKEIIIDTGTKGPKK